MVCTDTIFVVDDDLASRRSLGILLENCGFRVQTFGSGRDFLDSVADCSRCCVLLDIDMPAMGGLEVLRIMRLRGCDMPVVLITGGPKPQPRFGPSAELIPVLCKPLSEGALLEAIERQIGASP